MPSAVLSLTLSNITIYVLSHVHVHPLQSYSLRLRKSELPRFRTAHPAGAMNLPLSQLTGMANKPSIKPRNVTFAPNDSASLMPVIGTASASIAYCAFHSITPLEIWPSLQGYQGKQKVPPLQAEHVEIAQIC